MTSSQKEVLVTMVKKNKDEQREILEIMKENNIFIANEIKTEKVIELTQKAYEPGKVQ